MKIRLKHILATLGILIVDMSIYLILAMLLMNYEDNYDPSKGPFWSLESMDGYQRLLYLLWTAWKVINFAGIVYLGYRLVKRFGPTSPPSKIM